MDSEKISIIIPTYDSRDTLSNCISAILDSDDFENLISEVIIVDDNSKDMTSNLVSDFQKRNNKIKYYKLDKNYGAAYARNEGARLAQNSILIFIDSDVIVYPGVIKKMWSKLRDSNVVTAVMDIKPWNYGVGPELMALKWNFGFLNTLEKNYLINSFTFSIRKKIFMDLGGFSINFKDAGGEEYEFSHRLEKASIPVYFDRELIVRHHFESYFKRLLTVFKRGRIYASLLAKRKKFESHGGARPTEAITSFLTLLICIFTFISIFTMQKFLIIFTIFLILIYLFLNLKFYFFINENRNFRTLLKLILPNYFYSLTGSFGVLFGLLKYLKDEKLIPIKFLFRHSPTYFIWYPTLQCNARCGHCFNIENIKSSKGIEDLSLREIELICKNYGHIKYLTLSGGEPSLRQDLDKATYLFYRYNKLQYLNFITNGFDTKKIVQQITSICKSCPNLFINITISIDDLGNAHDVIRNVKKGFSSLLDTINELRKLKANYTNLEITSNSTLSEFNKSTIFDTHNFIIKELKIPHKIILHRKMSKQIQSDKDLLEIYKKISYLSEVDYDDFYRDKNRLYPLFRFRRIIDFYRIKYLIKILEDKKYFFNCLAGKTMLVLWNNGDILFCEPLMERRIGNLRKYNYSIEKLLHSKSAKDFLSMIKKERCFCDWDCIIKNNLVFAKKLYFKYLFHFIRNNGMNKII